MLPVLRVNSLFHMGDQVRSIGLPRSPGHWFLYTAIVIKLHTYRLPMNKGCALTILSFKGQSERTFRTEKGFFFAHNVNCFLFTSIFLKVQLQSNWWVKDELMMCPVNLGIQRSRSQNVKLLKMVSGAYKYLLSYIKIHPKIPHSPRMCPIDFDIQRSRS